VIVAPPVGDTMPPVVVVTPPVAPPEPPVMAFVPPVPICPPTLVAPPLPSPEPSAEHAAVDNKSALTEIKCFEYKRASARSPRG